MLSVAVVAVAVVAVSTTPATASSGPVPSHAPGVTAHSITVGSISAASGPLASTFGQIGFGVTAYFDALNARGGVDGRKVLLSYKADDGASPTADTTDARNLVEQDHVFAVVGVGTPFFTGASFFAAEGTPVFGYLVSQDWNTHPDLFGAYGSYLNYAEVEPGLVDIAKQLKAKSVAVVAYNIAAQSEKSCAAVIAGLKAAHIRVGFSNLAFGLGADPSADVVSMKNAHTDFFISCMEGADNLAFDEALRKNGVTGVKTLWLQGYNRDYLKQDPADMVGALYLEQHVPFEAATQFPGRYPAMEQYLKVMKKYEPKWTYNDLAFQGYLNAAQFTQGIREQAATGKPLTQARLIATINKEKAFTAGLTSPVNWTKAHTSTPSVLCGTFVEVERKDVLKVVFNHQGEVFACTNLKGRLVAPPKGTPGL
jgi:branched-chain amino acid transport system substrate-binding protein